MSCWCTKTSRNRLYLMWVRKMSPEWDSWGWLFIQLLSHPRLSAHSVTCLKPEFWPQPGSSGFSRVCPWVHRPVGYLCPPFLLSSRLALSLWRRTVFARLPLLLYQPLTLSPAYYYPPALEKSPCLVAFMTSVKENPEFLPCSDCAPIHALSIPGIWA